MFNLEKAIVAWRQDLAVAGIHRALALDELESHLRDDVEQRVRTGEQVEEAFRAAVARLGQPAVLQKEFAKVCTTKFRSLRAILRISCFVTAPTMFLAGAWGFWDADTEPLT